MEPGAGDLPMACRLSGAGDGSPILRLRSPQHLYGWEQVQWAAGSNRTCSSFAYMVHHRRKKIAHGYSGLLAFQEDQKSAASSTVDHAMCP